MSCVDMDPNASKRKHAHDGAQCNNPHCMAADADAMIDRAYDELGWSMVGVFGDDMPHFAYTQFLNDKIGVDFVVMGKFEPIEFNDILLTAVPKLVAQWKELDVASKLDQRIAAHGILQLNDDPPVDCPVELQRVHPAYIRDGMFNQAQLRSANPITMVQIVVFDSRGKLPGDPEWSGDSMEQPDLFLDPDAHDDTEPATLPAIEITGFTIP